jgi:hypothetical protein
MIIIDRREIDDIAFSYALMTPEAVAMAATCWY